MCQPGMPRRRGCSPRSRWPRCCWYLPALRCPGLPSEATKRARYNHRVTMTLTLIHTLSSTKKRTFPVISTRFAFVSPAEETGLQFQRRRGGRRLL